MMCDNRKVWLQVEEANQLFTLVLRPINRSFRNKLLSCQTMCEECTLRNLATWQEVLVVRLDRLSIEKQNDCDLN
jgi:hypothetical protein